MDTNISFVVKYFEMNRETDDLLANGRSLQNGMKVLVENDNYRVNPDKISGPSAMSEALRWNRWMVVSSLEFNKLENTVNFVGTYEDGTKKQYICDLSTAWFVKKDSVPKQIELPASGDIQEGTLEARIFEVVKAAMLKQDSALYHGAPFDILEAAKALTKQISRLVVTEVEDVMDKVVTESEMKHQSRERKHWTGISNTKRPGRD